MPPKQDMELIKKYAPILWLHEHDAFLPEDCEVMEKVAVIGKSSAKMKRFEWNQLADFKDSEKYYMDLPEIDYH